MRIDIFGIGIAIAGVVVGACGFVSAKKTEKKVDELTNKLGKAFDDISDKTEIEVADSIIEEAVKESVANKTSKAIDNTTKVVMMDVKSDIHHEVKKTIDDIYSDMKVDVKDEVRKQIGKIDIRDAKREVIKEAEKTAAKEFAESLDVITSKFSKQLDDSSIVFDAIAKKFKSE